MSNKYFDSANNPNRALPYEVARAEQINNTDDLIEAGLNLVEADVNRAIKLPADVTTDQVLTSTAAQRQNSLLAFDASGNATLTGTNVVDRSGKVMGWDNSGRIKLYSYANDITAPVNAAVASASAAASSATNSASSATASANSATASATSATNSVNSATASANSATAAATSAANAANSATAAAQSAIDATNNGAAQVALAITQATNAASSATAAASSATSAANSATTATTQATNASSSAIAAATSATNAANSATTASNAATTATTQANAATTQASNAATSAALASDWAQKTGGTVDGSGYSAKHWAQEAASIVTAGVIDDTTTSTLKTWSSNKVSTELATKASQSTTYTKTEVDTALSAKQNTLVSGTNIKTINGTSVLGSGDISLSSVNLSASQSTVYVTQTVTFEITDYNSFSDYVVQISAGSVSLNGGTITATMPDVEGTITLTVIKDGVAAIFAINVLGVGVETPINSSPADGATDQSSSVTLTANAFQWLGLADTHASSDWQVATDAGFTALVANVVGDTVNLTSYVVSGLIVSQTYYWRVKYNGAANGSSRWSAATSFVTKASFGGLVGDAGTLAFGVSECPNNAWLTELNLSPMVGTNDKASENYGNYQHANGGVSVFIPKFYYKIGDTSDPAYGTYGANTITIKGIETFTGEAAANVAGYALHRAFIDNGIEQPGFFIDKYLASKDGTSSCKSVKLGVPISLTTSTSYTNSNGMTGCTGILADSVVLSRARGAGWNCETVFQADALAKLSLAHAQHATSTTFCAWYDATGTTNFPKGCNNGSLADVNDASVTFTSAGDAGSSAKPKTGSASNLAKTTHNGQLCGVTDINGAMYQTLIGLTMAGTSGTDSTQITTGNAYVLKRTAAHRVLTGGFGGATDAWGTTSSLTTYFDSVTGFEPWLGTTGWVYFGNGASQVFSGDTSGTNYLRSCCGIASLSGMSASGTNQYGNDGCYQYGRANQVPLASGIWSDAAHAGAFFRYWNYGRSFGNSGFGFRCSAYGS